MKSLKPIRAKENFLIFASPAIEEQEIDAVVATMRSGWLGSGPRVSEFERDFRAYRRAGHAVALNSCTAALHLSLLVAGVATGDEVITTPLTFCATVNAIIHAGGTPVLADVDPVTMNIDPVQIRSRITGKTKAIVPVHFAGRPCDMSSLMDIAREHKLTVIEDCAHAIETEYRGRSAGTFGEFGCFSFYVTKNIVTGEGGMVLTCDEHHAARLKTLGLHGMSKDAWKRFGDDGYKHYQIVECGFKYNMTDMQAAIGLQQLRRVELYWRRREQIWSRYINEFAHLPVRLPAAPEPDTRHAYHLFTLQVSEARSGLSREQFIRNMTDNNIGVGVHYLSIPEHPYYQRAFGWRPEDYPNAMAIGRETVSIPISAKLSDADIDDVVSGAKASLS